MNSAPSAKMIQRLLFTSSGFVAYPLFSGKILSNGQLIVENFQILTGSRGIIVEISIKTSYLSKLHSCIYLRC